MKTPLLLASLAVAAPAFAAELKDSTAVAREWKDNTALAQGPLTSDLGLRAQAVHPPALPTWPVFSSDCWPSTTPSVELPQRSEPLYDAPGYRVPKNLPNNRPRGARPWEYDGTTYWLIPLSPAGK